MLLLFKCILDRLIALFNVHLFKGAVGSADLKISKSALLSLNHRNFSNTNRIYTE